MIIEDSFVNLKFNSDIILIISSSISELKGEDVKILYFVGIIKYNHN